MAVVIGVLVGASVVLAGVSVSVRRGSVLAVLTSGHPAASNGIGAAGSLRASVHRTLERWGGSAAGLRVLQSETLRLRWKLAGRPHSLEWVGGLKLALLVGGPALCAFLSLVDPGAILLVPIAFVVALRGPELVLARMGRRRRAVVDAQLPELIELLVATTQAGLGPPVALRRSADVVGRPLSMELRFAVREIDLGLPWRHALAGLAERTGAPTLRRLVGALARSQRIGTPLALTLRRVADDVRAERSARVAEQARQAPVKMLFPLVFLVLPAFLLLTVGPVVVATIRSLH